MPPDMELRKLLAGDVVAAARSLLGCRITRLLPDGRILSGRIVETEAYHQREPGCHAHRGMTARTRTMFKAPGFLYVYLIYGMYHCANIVSEQEGVAAAVLIRALEPEGDDGLRMSGPGLLSKALSITREHDGTDLLDPDSEVRLGRGGLAAGEEIEATRRVGFSFEDELDWRFCIAGNRFVSPGRPGVPVRRRSGR